MGQEFHGKGVHIQLGPAMNFMRYIKFNYTWLFYNLLMQILNSIEVPKVVVVGVSLLD